MFTLSDGRTGGQGNSLFAFRLKLTRKYTRGEIYNPRNVTDSYALPVLIYSEHRLSGSESMVYFAGGL